LMMTYRGALVPGAPLRRREAPFAGSAVVQLPDKFLYLSRYGLEISLSVTANGVVALLDYVAAPGGTFRARGRRDPLDGPNFVVLPRFINHSFDMRVKAVTSRCPLSDRTGSANDGNPATVKYEGNPADLIRCSTWSRV
jgi:hypothetical protein